MKLIKYIAFIVLSFLSIGIMAMQGLQTDFSKPGEDVTTIVSSDDTSFTVDKKLAQRSKTTTNIIEDMGLEESIPCASRYSAKLNGQISISIDLPRKEVAISLLNNFAEDPVRYSWTFFVSKIRLTTTGQSGTFWTSSRNIWHSRV